MKDCSNNKKVKDGTSLKHKCNGFSTDNLICLYEITNNSNHFDDTDRIQEALDILHINGRGKLILHPGLYRVTRIILIYSNTIIEGSINKTVIDATNLPQGNTNSSSFLFRTEGVSKSILDLSSDLSKGQTDLHVIGDFTEVKPGRLLVIRSTERQFPGEIGNIPFKEEIHRIVEVNPNTFTIVIASGLLFNYSNSQTLKAEIYDPTSNVQIKEIDIIMGGIGSVHSGIHVSYAYNISISNVTVNGAENVGISLSRTYMFTIENCKLLNSTSPLIVNYYTGYGIAINASSCYGVVKNSLFDNCRHGVTGGNQAPHHIKILDNLFTNCRTGYALGCHEPAMYWIMNSNIIQGCVSGINGRGKFITISENQLSNITNTGVSVGGTAGTLLPNAKQYVITHNNITNTGGRGIELRGRYGSIDGSIIEGNTCMNTLGIRVLETKSIIINNNIVDQTIVTNSPRYGVHIIMCENVTIVNNHLIGVGDHGIFSSESNNLNISNNFLSGGGDHGAINDGIRANIGKDLIITNNHFLDFMRHSIFTTNVDNIIFVNNIISDRNHNSIRFADINNIINKCNIVNIID